MQTEHTHMLRESGCGQGKGEKDCRRSWFFPYTFKGHQTKSFQQSTLTIPAHHWQVRMTQTCHFCAPQREKEEIQPHLLIVPYFPQGQEWNRVVLPALPLSTEHCDHNPGHMVKQDSLGCCCIPFPSSQGRGTLRMERCPSSEQAIIHPQICTLLDQQHKGTGITRGKTGQEGTGEGGSFLGKSLQHKDLPKEATSPPCKQSTQTCTHRLLHTGWGTQKGPLQD